MAIAWGVALMVVGYPLTHLWGNVLPIQLARSADEFVSLARAVDGGLERAFWADILILAPGYTLLFLGVFSLRQPRAARLCRWGMWLAILGTWLDQVQNVMILFGLDQVAAGSGPSDAMIGISRSVVTAAFGVLGTALVLSVVALTRKGDSAAG